MLKSHPGYGGQYVLSMCLHYDRESMVKGHMKAVAAQTLGRPGPEAHPQSPVRMARGYFLKVPQPPGTAPPTDETVSQHMSLFGALYIGTVMA